MSLFRESENTKGRTSTGGDNGKEDGKEAQIRRESDNSREIEKETVLAERCRHAPRHHPVKQLDSLKAHVCGEARHAPRSLTREESKEKVMLRTAKVVRPAVSHSRREDSMCPTSAELTMALGRPALRMSKSTGPHALPKKTTYSGCSKVWGVNAS